MFNLSAPPTHTISRTKSGSSARIKPVTTPLNVLLSRTRENLTRIFNYADNVDLSWEIYWNWVMVLTFTTDSNAKILRQQALPASMRFLGFDLRFELPSLFHTWSSPQRALGFDSGGSWALGFQACLGLRHTFQAWRLALAFMRASAGATSIDCLVPLHHSWQASARAAGGRLHWALTDVGAAAWVPRKAACCGHIHSKLLGLLISLLISSLVC